MAQRKRNGMVMVFGAALWLVLWGTVIYLVVQATRRWSGAPPGRDDPPVRSPPALRGWRDHQRRVRPAAPRPSRSTGVGLWEPR